MSDENYNPDLYRRPYRTPAWLLGGLGFVSIALGLNRLFARDDELLGLGLAIVGAGALICMALFCVAGELSRRR